MEVVEPKVMKDEEELASNLLQAIIKIVEAVLDWDDKGIEITLTLKRKS